MDAVSAEQKRDIRRLFLQIKAGGALVFDLPGVTPSQIRVILSDKSGKDARLIVEAPEAVAIHRG